MMHWGAGRVKQKEKVPGPGQIFKQVGNYAKREPCACRKRVEVVVQRSSKLFGSPPGQWTSYPVSWIALFCPFQVCEVAS